MNSVLSKVSKKIFPGLVVHKPNEKLAMRSYQNSGSALSMGRGEIKLYLSTSKRFIALAETAAKRSPAKCAEIQVALQHALDELDTLSNAYWKAHSRCTYERHAEYVRKVSNRARVDANSAHTALVYSVSKSTAKLQGKWGE